ncbi:MAG: sugar ABC transporter permease [Clostridia bacterium]|nr:sugar ABC transporter permease [Clostridia bacterium]
MKNFSEKKTEKIRTNRGKSGIFGKRSKWFIFAFLIFPLVQFFVFFVIVNYRSILMAFSDANGTFDWGKSNWLFFVKEWQSTEKPFQISLKNTLIYFIVSNFINLPLVIVFAYLLFKKCYGHRVFRVIFFMPSIIGVVVFCTLFRFFVGNFQGQEGPVLWLTSKLYNLFGAQLPENAMNQGLLGDSSTAFAAIMVETIWTGFGMSLILISGGLARLPESIFEAAKIDGVGMWGEFWHVVIPLLMPTVASVFMLNMAGLFTFYAPVMLLTEGSFETSTIGWYITRYTLHRAQSGGNLNYPAFVGVFVTIIAVPFILIVRKVLDKLTPDVSY